MSLSFGKKTVIHAVLLIATASSMPAGAITPAELEEVHNFQWSEAFLHRWETAMKGPHERKEEKLSLARTKAVLSSLDAMTAEITKSPRNVALLRQYGLSAREVVLASVSLLQLQSADDPQMAKYMNDPKYKSSARMPSDANRAFYHAHKAEIIKVMTDDEAAEKRNSGVQ